MLFSKLRPYLNKVVCPNGKGYATTELVPLRPKQDKLNKTFFTYLLRSDQFVQFANDISGGTKMPRMPLKELREFKCILPPIKLQEGFATIVRQADKSKFGGFKSQFIEMFGNQEWESKELCEIVHEDCPITYGIVQPGDDIEDGIPIVRPVDMNESYYIDKNSLKKTSESISNQYKRTILRGDELLVCVRGTTGLVSKADGLKGCNVTRGITPLYFQEKYNREFLFRVLLSDKVQDYIRDNTIGSTLKGINMVKLRELPIIMPPEDLQKRFISIAEQADKSKYYVQNKLNYICHILTKQIQLKRCS